jgi:hypothetical protein
VDGYAADGGVGKEESKDVDDFVERVREHEDRGWSSAEN